MRVHTYEIAPSFLPAEKCALCLLEGANITVAVSETEMFFVSHKLCFLVLANAILQDARSRSTL